LNEIDILSLKCHEVAKRMPRVRVTWWKLERLTVSFVFSCTGGWRGGGLKPPNLPLDPPGLLLLLSFGRSIIVQSAAAPRPVC